MAHDVFISYSSKDKPVADAVCAGLETSGIRCWIAPRDILAGRNWGEAIIDAILSSRIMVVIFSNNSNTSDQVLREVERAVHKGNIIIPFRIESVQPSKAMEYYLSTPHWLDALSPPLETHIQSLVRTVAAFMKIPNMRAPNLQPAATEHKRPLPVVEELSPDDWMKVKKKNWWGSFLSLFDDKT